MARATDLAHDVTVREIFERDEWNALVVSLPYFDLRQGYEWGEVRASQGWTPRRLAVFQGETCVAIISILVKPVPLLGRSILDASGGPLMPDVRSQAAWETLLSGIRRIAYETRAIFLRVSPKVSNEDMAFRQALGERGFRHLSDDWTTWNTPRILMTLDVRMPIETLKRALRKRVREHIAAASKHGVTVRQAKSLEQVREFYQSLVVTGRRKRVPVRRRAYFSKLWEEYLEPGRGVLLRADYQGQAVGGLLGARLGQTAYMLYVAVQRRPTDYQLGHGAALYWDFVWWAKEAGCTQIDWGGIGTHFPPRKNDPGFGVYHFKLGFNSSLQYLSGYYDLVFSPMLYRFFRLSERLVADPAWRLRALLNGGLPRAASLIGAAIRRVRHRRASR